MKIIAVGRNYAEHAKELNNPVPAEPVVFLKPDTAIIKDNKPFYHPSFSNDIHHEIEVVLRISKEGKHIAEKFSKNYYDAIAIGVDFTARDLQQKQKDKGLPWEIAKGFDGSAPLSSFISLEKIKNIQAIDFSLSVNGNEMQHGNTRDLLFSFDTIIAYVSRFFTLKKGDLIFTGTPSGVSKVSVGDHLEGWLEGNKLLDFHIK